MIFRNSRARTKRVKTKIVALLLSLVALWGFAAFVTLREGVNLLWVATLDTGVGKPTESLVSTLQEERRLSLAYLGAHRSDQRTALVSQRAGTDAAVTRFQHLVQGGDVQLAATDALRDRLTDVLHRLTALNRTRGAVDGGTVDRLSVANAFTEIIDSAFRIYG